MISAYISAPLSLSLSLSLSSGSILVLEHNNLYISRHYPKQLYTQKSPFFRNLLPDILIYNISIFYYFWDGVDGYRHKYRYRQLITRKVDKIKGRGLKKQESQATQTKLLKGTDQSIFQKTKGLCPKIRPIYKIFEKFHHAVFSNI